MSHLMVDILAESLSLKEINLCSSRPSRNKNKLMPGKGELTET